jgi:hypothetical protein
LAFEAPDGSDNLCVYTILTFERTKGAGVTGECYLTFADAFVRGGNGKIILQTTVEFGLVPVARDDTGKISCTTKPSSK